MILINDFKYYCKGYYKGYFKDHLKSYAKYQFQIWTLFFGKKWLLQIHWVQFIFLDIYFEFFNVKVANIGQASSIKDQNVELE